MGGNSQINLKDWLSNLVILRHHCAHNNRLWNNDLKIKSCNKIQCKKFFCQYLLITQVPQWLPRCWISQLKNLIITYQISPSEMGFPEDWLHAEEVENHVTDHEKNHCGAILYGRTVIDKNLALLGSNLITKLSSIDYFIKLGDKKNYTILLNEEPYERYDYRHNNKYNMSLADILERNHFDNELHSHVMKAVGPIEDAIKSVTSLYMSSKYGDSWYRDINLLSKPLKDIGTKNRKLSFSKWSKIFRTLQQDVDKIEIMKLMGFSNQAVLGYWLHHMSELRDHCAHNKKLWDYNFTIKPWKMFNDHYNLIPYSHHRVRGEKFYAQYLLITRAIGFLPPNWIAQLKELLAHRPKTISMADMGFPDEWLEFNDVGCVLAVQHSITSENCKKCGSSKLQGKIIHEENFPANGIIHYSPEKCSSCDFLKQRESSNLLNILRNHMYSIMLEPTEDLLNIGHSIIKEMNSADIFKILKSDSSILKDTTWSAAQPDEIDSLGTLSLHYNVPFGFYGNSSFRKDKIELDIKNLGQLLTQILFFGDKTVANSPMTFNGLQWHLPREKRSTGDLNNWLVQDAKASPTAKTHRSIYFVQWGENNITLIYPYKENYPVIRHSESWEKNQEGTLTNYDKYTISAGLRIKNDKCIARIANIDTKATINSNAPGSLSLDMVKEALDGMHDSGANAIIYMGADIYSAISWHMHQCESSHKIPGLEIQGYDRVSLYGHPIKTCECLNEEDPDKPTD